MKYNTLTFLFILTISAISCNDKYRKAANDIVKNADGTKNMNEGKAQYTIAIPDGWTTNNETHYGIDYFMMYAPKTEQDPNTNVNIITEYMQQLTLSTYLNGSIDGIKKAIPSAVILDKGDIVANGIKGAWYIYKMEPEGIKATLIAYIFPKDGIAYTITAGTQTKDFKRYRSLFDTIAKSFKFKD